MAQNTEDVEINVKVNAEGSIAQLRDLKQKMKELPVGSAEWTKIAKQAREIQENVEDAKVTTIDFADQLKAAPGPLGALGKGIDSVKLATQSFGTALKATGIGLVVAAIGGLVAAFSQSETAMKKLQPIMNAFQQILGGILKAFEPLIDAFLEMAIQALPYITKGIGIFYSTLLGFFTLVKSAGMGVANILKGIVTLDFSAVEKGMGQLKNSFSDAVKAGQEAYARFEQGTKEQTNIEKENEEERRKNAEDARKKREEAAKAEREKRIRDLDAQIENEISKENTSAEALKLLLDQRLKEELAKEKLSKSEKEKLEREYAKRLEDALKEDAEKKFQDAEKAREKEATATQKFQEKEIVKVQDAKQSELDRIAIALSKKEITEEQARQKTFQANKKAQDAELALFEGNKQKELNALIANKEAYKGKEEEYNNAIAGINEKYDKQIATNKKATNALITQDLIATNKAAIDEAKKFKDDLLKTVDESIKGIDTTFLSFKQVQERVGQELKVLQDLKDKNQITNEEYLKREADLQDKLNDSNQRRIDLYGQLAGVSGMLAQVVGEETAAGEALLKVQEALNIAMQVASLVNQINALSKKADAQATQQSTLAKTTNTVATLGNSTSTAANSVASAGNAVAKTAEGAASGVAGAAKVPFPGSLIAVISIVATFVGILASIKSMLSKKKEAEAEAGGMAAGAGKPAGSMFANGGLLVGPSHANGGIKSAYGELEGGEFVVNKRSTKSFMPLLQSINSVGNRRYANGGSIPSISDLQDMMTNQPQPIIKTYVVSSDMSSAMEADKKIADLAKL